MAYGTPHLHHVAVARTHTIHLHLIQVLEVERSHIELLHGINAVLGTRLTRHAYLISIGITRITTTIGHELFHRLAALHLVPHGALDLTRHIDQAVVGTYHDDIIVLQSHITGRITVDEIVIDIDRGNHASAAIHLDVTQGTVVIDTTGGIERIEGTGEAGQTVRAGHVHLTCHLHLNGTDVPYGEVELAVAVTLSQTALQHTACLGHGKTS